MRSRNYDLLTSVATLSALALPTLTLSTPALAETSFSPEEIVITANRIETPLARVGSSISIITSDDIEKRQTVLASELLREVPSVAVSRTSSFGSLTQVRIRGAEGNHTLVLIDGIEMNNPAQSSEFNFANLFADNIERIEILRGSQSTLYGSEAIGGVINIITRRATQPFEARALIEGGSFGTARGNLSLLGKNDKWEYGLTASGFRTDGISAADARNGNTEKDGYRNGTFSGRLGLALSDDARLTGTARYSDSRTESDPTLPPSYTLQDSNGVDYAKEFQSSLGLDFSLLDGKLQNRLHGTYADNESTSYANDIQSFESRSKQYKADYQTIVQLADGQKATAGGEFERRRLQSTFFGRKDANNYGFFGLYEASLTDALTLTAGLRHDHYESFGGKTTYRFTGAYLLADGKTKLHASYGTGYQAPNLDELYGSYGNPDLHPETSRSFDAGIDTSFLENRLQTEATFFYNKVQNLIAYAFDTTLGLYAPFNIDRSRAWGLEFTLRANPVDRVSFVANYTYTSARDLIADTPLVRRPKHMGSVNVSYQATDRLSTNVNVIYNGDMKDVGQVTLDSYVVVNLAAAYRLTDAIDLTGRVDNLFDEEYQQVQGFGTPGIAGYVGIRAHF